MKSSALKNYALLMRWDKPIGFFLVLWPTLWALWLAGSGKPPIAIVIIFVLGCFIMRSAGCVINDMADRQFDRFVLRTQHRPLASKKMSVKAACYLFLILMLCALVLVLFLNQLTFLFAIIGAFLAIVYPFLKRITHWPQLGLGMAFSWGVPMAFAAICNEVPAKAWLLFSAAMVWPVMYDTLYAMVDRVDDVKIGVKSTAIAVGKADRWFIGILQILFLVLLYSVGKIFLLGRFYYFSLIAVSLLFLYQQMLIKNRLPQNCFTAFLNNNWVGCVIFLGIVLHYVNYCG